MQQTGTDRSGLTVLVSGGSGFLGSRCVIEALRAGHEVRTTVRNLTREPEVRAVVAKEVDAEDRLSVLAADLNEGGGWPAAVDGCDYVLHVASPFPPAQPKDPDELIIPAREGTLRVLRAALAADVKRIVLTSSVAAIRNTAEPKSGPLTEADWTDPDARGLTPYTRSKTIAERSAWDLVRERDAEHKLAVINPGAILGPVLSADRSFSVEIVERLLKGGPGIPRIGFSIVDVRDVAAAHLLAMTTPDAAGERFIAAGPFQWMYEVGQILRDQLGEQAAKVPKRRVPNLAVRASALFDPSLRTVASELGTRTEYSHAKATSLLSWSPRPVAETVVDTGRSLIREGVVGV